MELIELENIWKEYDRKVTDNTRLNKEILKRMLMVKPERRLTWMKIKATIGLFSPALLLLVVMIMDIKFHLTANFYVGLSLFIPVYLIGYFWEVKYFFLVRKINFTDAILNIKKKIAELQKYEIKMIKIRYMLMPLAIVGVLLMLFQKTIFNQEFIIFLVLTILVYLASFYFRYKYSIRERFKKLDKEIEEIHALEK